VADVSREVSSEGVSAKLPDGETNH